MAFLPFLTAAAPILGSAISGMFNKSAAKDQMAFQAEMSNTAHQREVQDLIAAGLNPMLSAKLGGASSPAGASWSMPDLGQAFSAGQVARKLNVEMEKVQADTDVSKSQEMLNTVLAKKADIETRIGVATAVAAEWEQKRKEFLERQFNQWFVEGKELDARMLKAGYERLKASDDYNSIQFLNELAVKYGHRNWTSAIEDQGFRRIMQDMAQRKRDIPRQEAMEKFWSSEWGQEVGPYLDSAKGALDVIDRLPGRR